MKVPLDEMLPVGVAHLLPDHEVTTVKDAGFTGFEERGASSSRRADRQ